MSYLYLGSSSSSPASGTYAGPGSFLAVDANNSTILATPPGSVVSAVANGADNRVATFSSTDALNGEANLTFDGTDLLINSTGKLYFNDAGGEYITGDGSNLSFYAGGNNQFVAPAGANVMGWTILCCYRQQ